MNNVLAQVATRDRVRAPRYEPPTALFVSSKTIGTDLIYKMTTKNLSRTGLLLSWGHRRHTIPFIENTILELRIDPDGVFLRKPSQLPW